MCVGLKSNFPFHARLLFSVRMLQQARKHNIAVPNSYAVAHFVALAKQGRKVTLILILVRMIKERMEKPQDLKPDAYYWLVAHWEHCDRRELRDEAVIEMMRVHQSSTPAVASFLLRFLLREDHAAAATEVWNMLHSPVLSEVTVVNAELLSTGALICAKAGDVRAAEWISTKYKELNVTPDLQTLQILMSVYISAAQFDVAREYMQWIARSDYVLHELKLYEYLRACLKAESTNHSLCDTLLPLSDVLIDTVRLCSDEKKRLMFLRAYLEALSLNISNGRLAESISDVAECALRIFETWKFKDKVLSSYIVSIACRAGNIDVALQAAHAQLDHLRGKEPAASAVVRYFLNRFALEALVEHGIKESRLPAVLALMCKAEGIEPLNASCTAPFFIKYIHSFGRLCRLDICRELFDAFQRDYGGDVAVSNAYMEELGKAGHAADSIAVFESLLDVRNKDTLAPNPQTFALLGKIVLENLPMSRSGNHAPSDAALSLSTVDRMIEHLKDFVGREDKPQVPKQTEKVKKQRTREDMIREILEGDKLKIRKSERKRRARQEAKQQHLQRPTNYLRLVKAKLQHIRQQLRASQARSFSGNNSASP
ncbi:hypothetical protein FVE85_8905 [Porphyridium purpureum]|uniref:Pentatricopeptide repeat-containing protein n=1 Tax=Porphyridium purpureum TaxID=35688 RepID=A0A5J4YRA2_PORPP|nr:hypothetical protein FVE85_8905 [Porphyridium purpureum]|eukprot:POR3782..scf296_7